MNLKKLVKYSGFVCLAPFYLIVTFLVALHVRLFRRSINVPRLVWGPTPILNAKYWSQAMGACGYSSETFVHSCYLTVNERNDWDRTLDDYSKIPLYFRPFLAFIESLIKYDCYFFYCTGFFLGFTPLWWVESFLFKVANKKVIVLTHGGDSYVYKDIKSPSIIHGLLISYPNAARSQKAIDRRVQYWVKNADIFIPMIMGVDGFGRWDVPIPSHIFVDTKKLRVSLRMHNNVGSQETPPVVIAHCPNHRGFKGTEFIINAVEILKRQGLNIDLMLIEKVKNSEVISILKEKVDILVDQVIFCGYALNATEGMATGLPVICNLDDEVYTRHLRRWSFLDECPVVSATPENLVQVLRKLVTRPELRCKLAKAGRAYVEKYHSLESAQYLFSNVIDYAYGKKESLINLYHPLLGEYPNRSPKIEHPLTNNRIVD